MSIDKYILVDGEPVIEPNLMKWAQWIEKADRSLEVDLIERSDGPPIRISTVFLGLDHSFYSDPPILWETTVFGGDLDDDQQHYTSRQDAKQGHKTMVRRAQGNSMKVV